MSTLVVQAPLTTLDLSSVSLEERLAERKKTSIKEISVKVTVLAKSVLFIYGKGLYKKKKKLGIKGKTLKLLKSGPPEEEARVQQEWLSRVAQARCHTEWT